MKRSLLLLVACFTLSLFSYGQNEFASTIKLQAQEMGQATLNKEFEVLAKYTYPKILDLMGGTEAMITTVSTIFTQMEASGLLFESISMGEPSEVYPAGAEIHCLLPQSIHIKNTEGSMKSESWLLCISTDQGKNWSFLDVGQMSKEEVNQLFPDFNQSLVVPKIAAPEFVPN